VYTAFPIVGTELYFPTILHFLHFTDDVPGTNPCLIQSWTTQFSPSSHNAKIKKEMNKQKANFSALSAVESS
jgi:hypothetical protein